MASWAAQAHTAVDVDRLVEAIERELQQARDEDSCRTSPPTIHRVRPSIRDEDHRAYDPKIVSLGPFHRAKGKGSLQDMEKVKRRFLNNLLARSPLNSVRGYVEAFRPCEQLARAQYSGDIELSPDEFLETMVLDGCFLVECLVRYGQGELQSELASANCDTTILRNDTLLIENQIPFFVVEALLNASTIDWRLKEGRSAPTPMRLATHFLKIRNNLPVDAEAASGIHHLLHLYHSSLNPELSREQPHRSCRQVVAHVLRKIDLVSPIFYGTLYFILLRRWPGGSPSVSSKGDKFPRMIPCAAELRNAGICIKKRRFKDEGEECFLKVSFEDGTLQIPFLSVEEFTNSKFRNLIAFEQSCQDAGSYFTSYAIFIDNLINTAADVAVLRRCGVIESKLGSDEEVANMFNTVCKGAHLNYEKHYLATVFREVKEYSESSRHRWRATLVHDYFSGPWAAISVIAAFCLLVLTTLQTVYTMVAYYHPPNPQN